MSKGIIVCGSAPRREMFIKSAYPFARKVQPNLYTFEVNYEKVKIISIPLGGAACGFRANSILILGCDSMPYSEYASTHKWVEQVLRLRLTMGCEGNILWL